MKHNTKKGFTLVELLVVIAILAILATVSVVGYTSFIEGASLQVDKDLATQLNHFLTAYQVNHKEDITPDNIWEVTDEILELGGIEKLQAQTDGYHFFFKFDVKDGKYVGGEYVVAKNVAEVSPLSLLVKALDPKERPGFFVVEDELYFFVETTGTALAEAVRGFYTFNHLQGTAQEKWESFKESVDKAAADGHINVKDAFENTVFVTTEGSMWEGNKESYDNLTFHVDENVRVSEGTPAINVEVDEQGNATPVVVPENVEKVEVGSLNLNVDTETLNNAPVVFEKPAEELGEVLSPDFGYNFEDANGEEFTVNPDTAQIESTNGDKTVDIVISNYVTDFDIVISGTANKLYNSILTDELNIPSVVWDIGSFTLGAEGLVFSDNTKPASSKKINWELAEEYEGVSLEGNTVTLEKVNGYYPALTSIKIIGTVAHVPTVEEGETPIVPKTHEFTINLHHIDEATFTFGNNPVTDGKVSVLWGEKGDGSYMNSYDLVLESHGGTDELGLVYDSAITISYDWADTVLEGNNLTFNNVFDELSANGAKTQDVKITVNVGGYKDFTFVVSVNHAKFLFEQINSGLKYVGTDGENIKVSDLFKQVNASAQYENVVINAYAVPQEGQSHSIENLNNGYKLQVNAEGAEEWGDLVYVASQTTTLDGSFDFNMLAGAIKQDIILVVTVNGVRASENYRLTVVDAANVRDYEALTGWMNKTALDKNKQLYYPLDKNVVLLDDLTMSGDYNFFTIPAGITFYGNTFDFNIKGGRRTEEGIINLAGRIQDVRILGTTYSTFASSVGDDCGSSAIMATGNAYIYNCYIANTRSPLRTSGNTTIEDSVLFGGRYANIDMTGGTITIKGTVTTVQQTYSADGASNVIGMGISAWFNHSQKTVNIDKDADFVQYNFANESTKNNMPKVTVGTVEALDMKEPIEAFFTEKNADGSLKYASYLYYENPDDVNSTKYVNSGIFTTTRYMVNYGVTGGPSSSTEIFGVGRFTYNKGATKTVKAVSAVDPSASFTINYDKTYWNCTTVSDNTGSVTVTGEQLNAGVVFTCVKKLTENIVDTTPYDFQVCSDSYRTLVVTDKTGYNYMDYKFAKDLGQSMAFADAALAALGRGDTLAGKGLHYSKMYVDVYTPAPDAIAVGSYTYQDILTQYIEMTDGDGTGDNYYTPDVFEFNSNGTITNYWEK